MEELKEKYKDKNVEFFVVYSKEPHAGERRYFKKYDQHTSYDHKLSYARELVEEFGMKVPVLVDDLDEAVVGGCRTWSSSSTRKERLPTSPTGQSSHASI